jgi:hypothetical protein
MELMRRIRELACKLEFLRAGSEPRDRMDATLVCSEIEREYVAWGLKEISGLDLDGSPATPDSLVAVGPEELVREVVDAIKAETGLSEAERKN